MYVTKNLFTPFVRIRIRKPIEMQFLAHLRFREWSFIDAPFGGTDNLTSHSTVSKISNPTSIRIDSFHISGRRITQPPVRHSLHCFLPRFFFWEENEEEGFTVIIGVIQKSVWYGKRWSLRRGTEGREMHFKDLCRI
jgi:hypothetical protein